MSGPLETKRIFWMVRLLVGLGLATIALMIALMGWQLESFRRERANLHSEQARVTDSSHAILAHSSIVRLEIIALLDPSGSPERFNSADRLAAMAGQLGADPMTQSLAPDAVQSLVSATAALVKVEHDAHLWHLRTTEIRQDVESQQTMRRVRDNFTNLKGAIDSIVGKRRLADALQLRRWRNATGDEATKLAQSIVKEQSLANNRKVLGLAQDLAEISILIEMLGGEERLDNLTDLKDNKFTPALARLMRDTTIFLETQPETSAVALKSLENLTTSIFGSGYVIDAPHQSIAPGKGGLYTLRGDTLILRAERERIAERRSLLSHDIDVSVAAFMRAAEIRSASLTVEMEQIVADGWKRIALIGTGCSALFLWLAWLISKAIRESGSRLS